MADLDLKKLFPPIDRDALIKMLNSRDNLYQSGVEMLKEKMIPALQGHDYVPPYATFDDTPTLPQFDRWRNQGIPDINVLKHYEQLMENGGIPSSGFKPQPPPQT